jgi:hypothetical protein
MSTTTLDPQFLRAVVVMSGFKGNAMKAAQAALLLIGLRTYSFTGADLPAEVTQGSKHIAGAATGALIAQGLLEVIGRVKSPNADAKGRKLDLLHMPDAKRSTAITWLERNGFDSGALSNDWRQLEMAMT